MRIPAPAGQVWSLFEIWRFGFGHFSFCAKRKEVDVKDRQPFGEPIWTDPEIREYLNIPPIERQEMDDRDLMDMHRRIQGLKQGALALRRLGSEKGLPAVERNATRILAAIKMLEINICDLVED